MTAVTTRTNQRSRPPRYDRHHYVFLAACGCPFGLVESTYRNLSEDAAWASMYDRRRQAIQAARARGVHVVHVDHATYVREFFHLMTGPCPHAGPDDVGGRDATLAADGPATQPPCSGGPATCSGDATGSAAAGTCPDLPRHRRVARSGTPAAAPETAPGGPMSTDPGATATPRPIFVAIADARDIDAVLDAARRYLTHEAAPRGDATPAAARPALPDDELHVRRLLRELGPVDVEAEGALLGDVWRALEAAAAAGDDASRQLLADVARVFRARDERQ